MQKRGLDYPSLGEANGGHEVYSNSSGMWRPWRGGVQTRRHTYLDPKLWSRLPEAIVEKILIFLPFPILFKFRCVCKKWDANLSCPSFLRDFSHHLQHNTDHAGLHYILLMERKHTHSRVGLLYNKSFTKWLTLPLSNNNAILTLSHSFDLVASAGGLVCIKDKDTGSLSVHNPVNQSSRSLPPLKKSSIKWAFEVGMIMDPNGIDYQIIVWMDEPSPFTQIYFSKTHQWVIRGNNIDIRGDALSECGVVSGSSFYILVINEYLSVFAYSIIEDKWMELQAIMPPDILYSYLIDQWGSLIMVGAIGKDFPTKGICVWKLRKDGSAWEEVLRMPDNLYKRLTRGFKAFDAFKCAGKCDQICFVVDGRPRALMYDFSRSHWWWSPKIGLRGQYQIIAANLRLDTEA